MFIRDERDMTVIIGLTYYFGLTYYYSNFFEVYIYLYACTDAYFVVARFISLMKKYSHCTLLILGSNQGYV